MRSALFCLLSLLFCLLTVSAYPHLPALQEQGEGEVAEDVSVALEEGHGLRFRRATCDLLSFSSKWVTPNHAGCALHCIAKGYKGGNCKNTVCHCRK